MVYPAQQLEFVAAGKSWLDLLHAMQLLGIDEAVSRRLGITTLKVGMTWPMEPHGLRNWANGLQLIVVIEEKRKLIESQVQGYHLQFAQRSSCLWTLWRQW